MGVYVHNHKNIHEKLERIYANYYIISGEWFEEKSFTLVTSVLFWVLVLSQ